MTGSPARHPTCGFGREHPGVIGMGTTIRATGVDFLPDVTAVMPWEKVAAEEKTSWGP